MLGNGGEETNTNSLTLKLLRVTIKQISPKYTQMHVYLLNNITSQKPVINVIYPFLFTLCMSINWRRNTLGHIWHDNWYRSYWKVVFEKVRLCLLFKTFVYKYFFYYKITFCEVNVYKRCLFLKTKYVRNILIQIKQSIIFFFLQYNRIPPIFWTTEINDQ